MFHLGGPALSLLSVSAHTRPSPSYSLVPNQAHAFFAPMATDPDETGTTQPGGQRDANGLFMVVAKFILWPKEDNKNVSLFIVCLSNSKVSTFLPRLNLIRMNRN